MDKWIDETFNQNLLIIKQLTLPGALGEKVWLTITSKRVDYAIFNFDYRKSDCLNKIIL